jgi:hypothetical protein
MRRITVLIAIALILLPGLSTFVALPGHLRVGGAVERTTEPTEFPSDFTERTFQQRLELQFKKGTALWHLLVRADNELSVRLFGEASANYDSKVILGKQRTLFERVYVDYFNTPTGYPLSEVQDRTALLRTLQDTLNKNGLAFVLVLSPSKTSIYPELVPERYVSPLAPPAPHPRYATVRTELLRTGVNFVDGVALLQTAKSQLSYPMFARGGTHWSQLGACLVLSRTLDALSEQQKAQFPKLECSVVGEQDRPASGDSDLTRLANVFDRSQFAGVNPEVKRVVSWSKDAALPSVAIEGTSFVWQLLKNTEAPKIFDSRVFFYYSRAKLQQGRKGRVKVTPQGLDWVTEILHRDALILEINEASFLEVGHGLIESGLQQLKSPPDRTVLIRSP